VRRDGQFPGSAIAKLCNMSIRVPFDLGIERVLIDEPTAIKF
jgi:LemA protein